MHNWIQQVLDDHYASILGSRKGKDCDENCYELTRIVFQRRAVVWRLKKSKIKIKQNLILPFSNPFCFIHTLLSTTTIQSLKYSNLPGNRTPTAPSSPFEVLIVQEISETQNSNQTPDKWSPERISVALYTAQRHMSMVSFSSIGRGAQFVQKEKPISNACLFSTCKDGEIGPTCFQTQDWIQPNVKSATQSSTD